MDRLLGIRSENNLIPVRFLVMSDTHDFQFDDMTGSSCRLQLPTPEIDVLLHCGDLTQIGGVLFTQESIENAGHD